MEITIDDRLFKYDRIPDVCPQCHQGMEPRRIGANVVNRKLGETLQMVFRCPLGRCHEVFIANYMQHPQGGSLRGPYCLQSLAPIAPKQPGVPKEVAALSELFVEIYSQAATAEQHNLDQVAGPGYRKALEFLVKDYSISRHPGLEQEIKATFLGTCIDRYIDDADIKECARRATWLGNDETHYVRKWQDNDIRDLKILIELTVGWIRNKILTEEYKERMKPAT